MKLIAICIAFEVFLLVLSKPISPKETEKEKEKSASEEKTEDVNLGLEYERYLKEVVAVLEKDESFKSKISNANESDIKSGKIAQHLKFVSHEIRSKLDELKRSELDRLRMLVKKKMRDSRAQGSKKQEFRLKFDPRNMIEHMDHENPEFFGARDLEYLIKKATKDLELIDQKREEEFKKYEMEKEHLRRQELQALDEEKRKEEQQKFDEAQKKHKDHPKLHEPGHKPQLEEVWEDEGHKDQDFNPKTFFIEHDLNGDGLLDEEEIEALFLKELEKMYNESEPEDDMNEKYEEMYRMRIKVIEEMDKDKDKFISMQEFMEFTNKDEFETDEGWKGLDEEEIFSEEELAQFEEELAKEYPPGEKPPPVHASTHTPIQAEENIKPVEHKVQESAKVEQVHNVQESAKVEQVHNANVEQVHDAKVEQVHNANVEPVHDAKVEQVHNADVDPLVNKMEQPLV